MQRRAARRRARTRARTLLTFHPLQQRPTRPSVVSQERLQQFLSRAHERGAALAREREEAARRLELQSEQLESNAQGQRAVASENAASHATELVAARGAAAREAAAAAEREDALRMQLEAAQACTARERREKDAAQRQLDALNASAVAAAGGGAGERAAVVGGAAELHDARLRAERDATDARAALESVKAELQRAKDEASRERLRADGADAQVEREQIKGRRATALAEAERDVMRERLQHRGEAIDEAMSEVQLAEERVRQEARSVRQHAAQQVERAEKEKNALEANLKSALDVTAELQEMLSAQRELAEGYREQAQQGAARLRAIEAPGGSMLGYRGGAAAVAAKLGAALGEHPTALQQRVAAAVSVVG